MKGYENEIAIARRWDEEKGEYIYILAKLTQILENKKELQLCYVFHSPTALHVQQILRNLCILNVEILGEMTKTNDFNFDELMKLLSSDVKKVLNTAENLH